MKKIFFYFGVCLLLSSNVLGQSSYEVMRAIDFFRQNKLASGEWKTTLSEVDIQGSPYLNDEFVDGSVYTVNKQKFTDIPLRYNVYNDAVEFKSEDGKVLEMDSPELVEKVEFGGNTMVYLPFSNLKKIRNGFFIVVVEGNASLYYKPEIIYKEAVHPAAYKDAEPAMFIKKSDKYYIKIGTSQAKLIASKSDFSEIFNEKWAQTETFIKKNKTKINLEDLKELVNFFNTL